MKIEKLDYIEDKHGRTILNKNIKDISGVYLLFDKDIDLLYIGQTKKLRSRLWAHVARGLSSRNDNPKVGDWNHQSKLKLGSVKYYYFIKAQGRRLKDMIEYTLISILSPKLNSFCESDFSKMDTFKE